MLTARREQTGLMHVVLAMEACASYLVGTNSCAARPGSSRPSAIPGLLLLRHFISESLGKRLRNQAEQLVFPPGAGPGKSKLSRAMKPQTAGDRNFGNATWPMGRLTRVSKWSPVLITISELLVGVAESPSSAAL